MKITFRDLIRRSDREGRRVFARAAGGSRAGGLSTQLFRAGALQPDSGRDRPDRQHGRRCALAAVLQRRVGGARTRSKRTRRCSFTRSGTCCATTRRARRPPASGIIGAGTPPATARSTTISTPRACRCQAIRRCPPSTDWRAGTPPRSTTSSCRHHPVQTDARRLVKAGTPCRTAGRARTANGDSGSCRQTMSGEGGTPGVDRLKAELVRREVARRIDEISPYAGDVPPAWRRWARATLAPKVDYMATIRHVVRRALRDSTLGRYDRTYRRPHRRQACYGEFIMPSFHQPRPRPGFLIDTSSSMEDSQLARAAGGTGGPDAPARVRRGRRRRVLRCRGARRAEGLRERAGRVVRRRRHGPGCRAARVHRAERAIRSTCWSSSATATRRGRTMCRRFR